jgi:hypothetical protein
MEDWKCHSYIECLAHSVHRALPRVMRISRWGCAACACEAVLDELRIEVIRYGA